MPCETTRLPGGMTAIVCTRGRRPLVCSCGARAAFVCDWEVAEGKTCDAAVCSKCTLKPERGKDLCPTHAAEWKAR